MSKQNVLMIIVLSILLCLPACVEPQNPEAAVQIAGDNQTWFDAPLNGSVLPLAPYEIVLHGYTGSGVAQVELSANGVLLGNLPNPGNSGNLVTFKYTWTPASKGNYTLGARTQGTNGHWGAISTVNVTVGGDTVTPIPTASSTVTPTPPVTYTPSVTDTITPTVTFTPTQTVTVSSQLVFSRSASTGLFYYGDCNPRAVTVKVQVSDPNAVGGIVLFQKLGGQGWDAGTSMQDNGGGSYSLTVVGNNVPGHDGVESAVWVHQLVATGPTGEVIARSQNFNDVTLSKCVSAPQPEQPQQAVTTESPVIIPVRDTPTPVPMIIPIRPPS